MATLTIPGSAQGFAPPLLNVGGLRQASFTISPRMGFNRNAISTQKLKLRSKALTSHIPRMCTGARATAEDMKENPPSVQPSPDPEWMLRKREVLAMAASAGVSMLFLPQDFAWGAPVPTPDNFFTDNCSDDAPCCNPQNPVPLAKQKPKAFTPPSYEVKLRRKIGNVDPGSDYVRMYKRAYELLRKKSDENPGDPRYYTLQAEVHCKYCTPYYNYTIRGQTRSIDIHNSYLFLPWHRLYLHFHERILHSLLKEDSEFGERADEFALPFWNYDNPDFVNNPDTRFPAVFADSTSSLYNENRVIKSTEPLVRLFTKRNSDGSVNTSDPLPEENLRLMRQVVQDTSATDFFGFPYRAGSASRPGGGPLERSVHGRVHVWVGGDMGFLDSSARDPIFFGGHHSNIDRLWDVWYTLPTDDSTGPRINPVIEGTNITDPDWLNAGFLFFDENGDVVLAKVSDALDPVNNLKYRYEDVPNPWINYVPPPSIVRSASARLAPSKPPIVVKASREDSGPFQLGKSPIVITSIPSSSQAELPEISTFSLFESDESGSGSAKDVGTKAKEKFVVLEGVKYDMSKIVDVHVFINLPGANQSTSILLPEFLGSFTTVPMSGMNMEGVSYAFNISRAMAALNLSEEDVTVTLVPMNPDTIPDVTFEKVLFK